MYGGLIQVMREEELAPLDTNPQTDRNTTVYAAKPSLSSHTASVSQYGGQGMGMSTHGQSQYSQPGLGQLSASGASFVPAARRTGNNMQGGNMTTIPGSAGDPSSFSSSINESYGED